MNTLIKIAWRNVWRNKTRSLVIIIAISLGLIGGNFISSAYIGLMNQTIKETIEKQISHIQFHDPDFISDRELRYNIEDAHNIFDELLKHPKIKSVAARTKMDGMIASPYLSSGVTIIGVEPEWELKTTAFDEQIIEGTYFKEDGRLPSIVIGEELADKMQSRVGSRIVLTFHDVDGEMISATFRVEGIFRSVAAAYEMQNIFVETNDINRLISGEDKITEIAVLLKDHDKYREVAAGLSNKYTGIKVRHWDEIAPDIQFIVEYTEMSMIAIIAVIMLGVSFGILNTILMSVLERVRELGMLMSIGMKRIKIFSMIVLETVFLSITGGVVGMVLSSLLIGYVHNTGLDLSAIGGEGLREFGFSPLIYPELNVSFYIQVTIVIVIFAILASIYPARKAIKLAPAQAVRQE